MSPIFSRVNYNSINVKPETRFSRRFGVVQLGSSFGGGRFISSLNGVVWIVAPSTTEVSRNWYCRNDAVTTAQAAAACGDWFVPTCNQLLDPGYNCRTYWDNFKSARYWSSSGIAGGGYGVIFSNGSGFYAFSPQTYCVRAFRCVTY